MRQVNRTRKRSTTSALAAALVAVTLAGCGGSQAAAPPPRVAHAGRRADAPTAVPVRPIEVSVRPKRSGGSLEVAIHVIGRGHGEGEAFEDQTGWSIVALDARGQELRRIMNGPG